MNDQELRALVRAAVVQYTGAGIAPATFATLPSAARAHPSHTMFITLPAGVEVDGPCLIEPAVACTHCGYCKSYGH